MVLVDNWKVIAKKAYTMWISYILVFLGVFFMLMTIYSDWMTKLVGPWVFAIAFLVIGGTVGIARLKGQPGADAVEQ